MIYDFIAGVTSYASALNHITKHKLWSYVLLPGLLSLLLGLGIFGMAWGLAATVGELLDNLWVWDWGRTVVEKASTVLGGILVLIIGLILFKQIIIIVLGPLMSALSKKVEHQLLGDKFVEPKMSFGQNVSVIFRSLKIVLRNIIRELLFTLLLLTLGFVPLLSPFVAVFIFLLQSYYAGFGNLDFALERHLGFKDSIRFVHRQRGLAIGNGVIYIALLFTIIGFLVALPLSTVAATIETVKRVGKIENQDG